MLTWNREAARLISDLRRRRGLLMTIESCTGGLLASKLTDIPGVSDVFWGGAVSYRVSAKSVLAGVSPALIERRGAVSEETAGAMALGGLGKLKKSREAARHGLLMAISVTGLAGPAGDGRGLEVGTCFVGVAVAGKKSGRRSVTGARSPARNGVHVSRLDPPKQPLSRLANKRRFARHALRQALAVLALLGGAGCSSTPSVGTYRHTLHRIALDTVHFRRPAGDSASDSVYPDEEGYRSSPPPSASLDCQSQAVFFSGVDLMKLGECLTDVTTLFRIEYRLELDNPPRLVLEEPTKAPACLAALLKEIPLPREIVFQNDEESDNRLSCFSSRIDLSEGRILGVKNPLQHTYIEVDLPLASPDLVSTPARTVNLLTSWVLTPFLTGDDHEIQAKVIPNGICRSCFGEMKLLKPEDRPVYWPNPD